jgi:hypothetical protein
MNISTGIFFLLTSVTLILVLLGIVFVHLQKKCGTVKEGFDDDVKNPASPVIRPPIVKACVLISGPFRNANDDSINSIIKNVIKPLHADVYVFTWDVNAKKNPLRNKPKVQDVLTEYETKSREDHHDDKVSELIEKLNPISVNIEKLLPVSNYYNGKYSDDLIRKMGQDYICYSSIYMTYGWGRCLQQTSGKTYDWYVRIRPDVYISNSFNVQELCCRDTVYFSNNTSNMQTKQLSDKLFVATYENFKKICDIYNELHKYFNDDYDTNMQKYKSLPVGERLVYMYVMNKRIKFKILSSAKLHMI